jgi:hypothetical protein
MNLTFKKYWRKTSFKKEQDGHFFLNHVFKRKPKNFLEIGVFHGVTSRNVCELLYLINKDNFKFTGIDLFLDKSLIDSKEHIPQTTFSNPLKTIYYRYIIRLDPYSLKSVQKLLRKFKNNISIIKGDSNKVLKNLNIKGVDYVLLDGGHKYETVKNDLKYLKEVIINNGVVLCDDYDLSYAPGVKNAINEFVTLNDFELKIFNSRFAEITKKKV